MYDNTKRELQFLFRVLNENIFHNQFLVPQIYISINTRCKNWRCNPFGDKGQYVITIYEERLEDNFETIVMNMLHQMIHIFCFEQGLKDTSRDMRYHNKIFYQEGIKRGLRFSFTPKEGYITEGILGEFISDMVLQILSYVAQTQRESIRKSQADGIRLAKAKGVKFGRPKAISKEDFLRLYGKVALRELDIQEACEQAGISTATFRRYEKEYIG